MARVGLDGSDARWLDMCAGPGGKARLLAGLATQAVGTGGGGTGGGGAGGSGAGARLVAAELREHRARLVQSAVTPAGSAGVIVADGTMPAWRQPPLTG